MISIIDKKSSIFFYYRCALAIGAVFTFFTNLDLFLNERGISPYSPVTVIILFALASTPLLFPVFSKTKHLPMSLTIWCTGYLTISLLSLLLFLVSEVQYREFRMRLLSVIFLMTMTLVFSGSTFIQRLTRYALFGATILAIFTTIYNLFDPLAFRVEAISTAMRPAGFYVDSNKTGCALIFGMIFCTGLVQSKYRVYFVSVIGAVILLTFSRGAILSWFIIVIVMSSQQLVPRGQLLYSLLFLVTIIFCLGLAEESLISLSQQAGNQSYNNIAERLQLFSNPSSLSDESSDARFEVARQGWQMFAQHPLFGNGIGSTLELSIGISTHNMYLYYMADHGILGTFIVPALVYAVTRKSQGESKQISISFAALILLWSLFSHTVIEDRFILIMISLMAAMSVTSQLEHKSQLGHKL